MNATYIIFLLCIILIASLSNTEGLTSGEYTENLKAEHNLTKVVDPATGQIISQQLVDTNLKTEHNQLLKNIAQSQTVEQSLYNNLKDGSDDNSNIVDNINKMSEYRNTIFDKLLNQSQKSSTRPPKNDGDSKLLDEITGEISLLKQKISNTKNTKNENVKQAEINNYYSERSKAYVVLFKNLFYCSIPLLILSVLINRDVLPDRYGNILIIAIISFTILWCGGIYYDIISRDNMNFNEYDFDSNYDTTVSTPPKGLEGSFWPTGCTNEDCCAKGMVYDSSNGKCVITSTKN